MHDLPERKRHILRAVIVEYVYGAEPVASDLLTVKYDLGIKSATVRNELAEMSDLGYLEQPHTSAGRVPSDKGYRFYVDHLIEIREPNQSSKNRVRESADEGEALHGLLEQTTRTLSRLTHLMSAATTVRGANLTIKSAFVSAFGPRQALVALGLSNGEVHNRLIECPASLTLVEVGQANDWLNIELVGRTVRSVRKHKFSPVEGQEPFVQLVYAAQVALRSMFKELTRGANVIHGEEFLLTQPEFAQNAAAVGDLLESFNETNLIFDALAGRPELGSDVTIGKENRHDALQKLSVVRQSFYVGADEAGSIAVIGPTRMNYESSLPLVQFAARAISEALTKFARE